MDFVLLQCKKIGTKLKVVMMSSQPFIKGFYCQFPRNIREADMYYVIKATDIKLNGTFYSAMKKNIILYQTFDIEEVKKYIGGLSIGDEKVKPKTIFGDDDNSECVICFSQPKDTVFAPCGHYMTCSGCAEACKCCPICRGAVSHLLSIGDMKSD